MGEFITWTDELSVGIEEINGQHKVLIHLINRMHNAIEKHQGSDVVIEILTELADYTKIHFTVEESIMRILGYPVYEEHKAIHDVLLEQVVELQSKVSSGKTAISFELMHFLKTWLSKHIMEEDMKYSSFFLASGAKPEITKKSWLQKLWGS